MIPLVILGVTLFFQFRANGLGLGTGFLSLVFLGASYKIVADFLALRRGFVRALDGDAWGEMVRGDEGRSREDPRRPDQSRL